MTMTGQCLCGAVRYEIDEAPRVMGVCHCKNCQRQAGSAYSTVAGVPRAQLRFIAGEPKRYEDHASDSGNVVERYFCGHCGSPIYSMVAAQPDTAYLKAGTLDDTSGFAPMFHIWCDSKQAWVQLEEGVAQMARQS